MVFMPDGRSISVMFRHASVVIALSAALISTGWLFAALLPRDMPLVIETSQFDEPPSAEVIAGRTLDEWRELMKSVALNDPERGEYVPALIEIVQSPQMPWFTRRQAAQTLGRWGEPAAAAVPVLERLLEESENDPEETTTFWALKGLSLFGPLAAATVPSVSRIALDSKQSDGHRLAAMECLSQIGSAHPAGAAALIQISQSADPMLRRGAIEALGLFRGGVSVAIPALLRCLDDPDIDLRREAAVALGRQGAAAEIAQPALFDRLTGDPDAAVRDAAGTALAQTGITVLPALMEVLKAEDPELRWRAAKVIGQFGRRGASAAPTLKPLWDDPDELVRLAALEASWKTTGTGATIASRIADLLTSDDRNTRRQAYLLLLSLGDARPAARPVLESQLTHPRAEVRATARKLLGPSHSP